MNSYPRRARSLRRRSTTSAASAARISRSIDPPPPPDPLLLAAAVTVTSALALAVPPGPEQLRVKVVVAVSAELVTGLPVGLSLPSQAELLGLADAVQLVAFEAVHVSVTVLPDVTLELLALSVTTGATATLIAYVPAASGCELVAGAGCARTLTV